MALRSLPAVRIRSDRMVERFGREHNAGSIPAASTFTRTTDLKAERDDGGELRPDERSLGPLIPLNRHSGGPVRTGIRLRFFGPLVGFVDEAQDRPCRKGRP